jgi:hypothetical protein
MWHCRDHWPPPACHRHSSPSPISISIRPTSTKTNEGSEAPGVLRGGLSSSRWRPRLPLRSKVPNPTRKVPSHAVSASESLSHILFSISFLASSRSPPLPPHQWLPFLSSLVRIQESGGESSVLGPVPAFPAW